MVTSQQVGGLKLHEPPLDLCHGLGVTMQSSLIMAWHDDSARDIALGK